MSKKQNWLGAIAYSISLFWLTGTLALCLSFSALADDLQAPKFPVPSHISQPAQAVLNRPINVRAGEKIPSSKAEWRQTLQASTRQFQPILDTLVDAPVSIQKSELASVTVRYITPINLAADHQEYILMNVHGGAYVHFGGDLSVLEGIGVATASGYKVVSVDYRMPPDHPFPAAVDDSVAVYEALLKDYAPENIVIFGASAGGGLTAATIVQARDKGLPLPAAAIMNTPWSDLSKTGDTYYTLAGVDPILPYYDGFLAAAAELYAGEYGLMHPLVSPVYADFKPGFPPSLLISGTRDLLLSCTVRLHLALRDAGVSADLLVFEAMWHGFGVDTRMSESQQASREISQFLQRHLGRSRAQR